MLFVAALPLQASELYDQDGVELRWDNDLRYSAGVRVASPDTLAISYPNSDDGDRNFAPGMIMNRLDVISVLDATANNFGAQLSLDAWYDTVYQRHTDNKSPSTYNPATPAARFAPQTVHLDGQYAELGDSFIYGNFDLGGTPISVRAGRQTLLWGESLFFDQNGIDAGMAPIDYIQRATSPGGYSRDVFLPVSQISFTAQLQPDLSLAGYYQLEWRPDRLAGVGSFFSDDDVQGAGAYRAFLSGGHYLLHAGDQKPSGGQYGVSLRKTLGDLELGAYALRFNAKYPMLAVEPAAAPAANGYAGSFESVYPSGTDLYGMSFSTYLDDSNVAGEISLRRHMPLVSRSPISLTLLQPLPAGSSAYAEGDTLHGQVSSVSTFGPSDFWNSADVSTEIAANDVLDTADGKLIMPGRTRFAASFRVLLQPHYFQVVPNLDISPSLSLGYNFSGVSTTDYSENRGTGDVELGFAATYLSVWTMNLAYTSFFGAPYRQPLTDRDFVLFSLGRSF